MAEDDVGEVIAGIILGIIGGLALAEILKSLVKRKCPQCGNAILQNQIYCLRCGNRVN